MDSPAIQPRLKFAKVLSKRILPSVGLRISWNSSMALRALKPTRLPRSTCPKPEVLPGGTPGYLGGSLYPNPFASPLNPKAQNTVCRFLFQYQVLILIPLIQA